MSKKRLEYFAFSANEFSRTIHFTRHFSKYSAQKHYGDLRRHYRGSAQSDYYLSIYEGREEFERSLGDDYIIDYKGKTLTPKAEQE